MKRVMLFMSMLLMSLCTVSFSQDDNDGDKKSPWSVSTDLMSRYVWRGTDFGGSPSIQPGIDFTKSGLSIGTWGAFTTNSPNAQELDIYVFYTFMDDKISVGVTDYFFPTDLIGNNNYFEYNDTLTGHVYEFTASWNGTEDFPLSFLIATNFYGADAKKNDENGIPTNDLQYSTYAELSYSFEKVDVFAGFSVMDPDETIGETGFYGHSMGFCNIGCTLSKDIMVSDDFSLPLIVSFITNPMAEKVYLVAGFSF